jgi:hypothetical protein
MKSRFQVLCSVSFAFALALGACSGDDKDPMTMFDAGIGGSTGGSSSGGTMQPTPMCPAMCPDGQVCSADTNFQCMPVAGPCPCPKGAHCDAMTNMCAPGCETNADCNMGEMCDASTGTCSPGCNGTLVPGLTLSKVALNQAVSITLGENGAASPAAMRPAPVVQNRPALIRAFVKPEATYKPTMVTAILRIDNGGVETKLMAGPTMVTAASTENVLDSTINFNVEAPAIGAATKLSIELTQNECATTPGNSRFPTSGTVALEAQKTGVLKVVIVPNEVAPNKLDVSAPAVQAIKDALFAQYPVESVEVTVHDPVPADATVTLQKLLQTTRALRLADKPSADTYYMGLLTSKATFREACPTGCVAGISTLGGAGDAGTPDDRYGVALGYLAETAVMANGGMATTERAITLNEITRQIGHAHGRPNAPCGTPLPESVDPMFPTVPANAAIDTVGYHLVSKAIATPETHKDFMGFCSPNWVHSYTYNLLSKRVKAVAGMPAPFKIPGPTVEYASVLVQSNGEHFWGDSFKLNEELSGEKIVTRAFDANGNVAAKNVAVTLTELSEASDVIATFAKPNANWASIEINGQRVPVAH